MKNNQINQNNKSSQNTQIKIPCGSFCSGDNCSDCKYAEYQNKNKYGQIACGNSHINAWVYPSERYGCWWYEYERG